VIEVRQSFGEAVEGFERSLPIGLLPGVRAAVLRGLLSAVDYQGVERRLRSFHREPELFQFTGLYPNDFCNVLRGGQAAPELNTARRASREESPEFARLRRFLSTKRLRAPRLALACSEKSSSKNSRPPTR
jgi:hypothetical protein